MKYNVKKWRTILYFCKQSNTFNSYNNSFILLLIKDVHEKPFMLLVIDLVDFTNNRCYKINDEHGLYFSYHFATRIRLILLSIGPRQKKTESCNYFIDRTL